MSGYAQSKWVSESLVLQAIGGGTLAGNVSRYNIYTTHSHSLLAGLTTSISYQFIYVSNN